MWNSLEFNSVNNQLSLRACYISSPVVDWGGQIKFKTWSPKWMDHCWWDKGYTKQLVNETKLNDENNFKPIRYWHMNRLFKDWKQVSYSTPFLMSVTGMLY